MNDVDLDEIEKQWAKVPDVTSEESPETTMAIKAHACFVDKITLASAIKKRRNELGLDGELAREKLDGIRTINGLCRKANGDIDRVSETLKEDALKWQKAVNKRKNELKEEISEIQKPMVAFIKKCEEEDAAAEKAIVEAELKAKQDAENARLAAQRAADDAKRAAEAEANRIEAERLAKEREAIAAERAKAEKAAQIERARIAAEAAETARILQEAQRETEAKAKAERDRLNAEMNARLTKERAEQAAKDKAAKELAQAQANELARIEEELEQFRREKAAAAKIEKDKAEADARRKADEERAIAEAKRLEAMKPDAAKINAWAKEVAAAYMAKPEVVSDTAKEFVKWSCEHLNRIARECETFGTTTEI